MLSGFSLPRTLLIAVLVPFVLPGQSSPGVIAGPAFGFVFDASAQTLKPLLGNPSAAMIGPASNVGAPLSAALVSPRQDYALVVTADRTVALVRLNGAAPQLS